MPPPPSPQQSISLPAYLQMLHSHQADLGMHVTRLEDTCHQIYQMYMEGRRREESLVTVIAQLFDFLKQSEVKGML